MFLAGGVLPKAFKSLDGLLFAGDRNPAGSSVSKNSYCLVEVGSREELVSAIPEIRKLEADISLSISLCLWHLLAGLLTEPDLGEGRERVTAFSPQFSDRPLPPEERQNLSLVSICKDPAQATRPTVGPSLSLDDGDLGLVRPGPGACGPRVVLCLSPGRGRGGRDAAQTDTVDATDVGATHPVGATCSPGAAVGGGGAPATGKLQGWPCKVLV